jgi:hypothetical protein
MTIIPAREQVCSCSGYIQKDGTYVASSHATSPNRIRKEYAQGMVVSRFVEKVIQAMPEML